MNKPLRNVVPAVGARVAQLDSGALAGLRRDPRRGSGCAAYWWVVAPFDPSEKDEVLPYFVQAIALLTPHARRGSEYAESVHDPKIPLGCVLRKAGILEHRLNRLLATPKEDRGEAIHRIARRLSRTNHKRMNTLTIAQFLYAKDDRAERSIAKAYYITRTEVSSEGDEFPEPIQPENNE